MICMDCNLELGRSPLETEFCARSNLPLPRICETCQIKRLYSFRNLRTLHRRQCDKCRTQIISMFRPDAPRVAYCRDCWWKEDWDPRDYGREFDFSKTLAEQIDSLLRTVPLSSLINGHDDNTDYANFCWENRNCYLLSASDYNQDCLYSSHIFRCRSCIDCLFCNESELLYDCLDSVRCYNSSGLQECAGCRDSSLLIDCRDCSNCTACIGLRRSSFCLMNEQLSEEDYLAARARIRTDAQHREELISEFGRLYQSMRFLAAYNEGCEDVSGNHLFNCCRTTDSFDSIGLEDCSFCITSFDAVDCRMCIGASKSELCYQVAGCPENYCVQFSTYTWPRSSYLQYCYFCRSSSNCFGCVALLRNEFCILNKQYSEPDFRVLVEDIRRHATETGEYGEFLPQRYSFFPYAESEAAEYFPAAEAKAPRRVPPRRLHGAPAAFAAPQAGEIRKCSGCGRNFRLVKPEIDFYLQQQIEAPEDCSNCRHDLRMQVRNGRNLRSVRCAECGADTFSAHPREVESRLLCQDCHARRL